LRIYTPETPVYDDEGFAGWDNDNYRIVPESGIMHARTWFDRRPLALNPGIYVVETLNPVIDVVEPLGDKYDERVRVSIKPGQITEVLNDLDRPKFRSPTSRAVRGVYGDIIGLNN
jgi:hypothetical protein